jgi:hypothetical protein
VYYQYAGAVFGYLELLRPEELVGMVMSLLETVGARRDGRGLHVLVSFCARWKHWS